MWTMIALLTTMAAAGPLDDALNQSKKAKVDPKGKAMELYLKAEIERKRENFDEASNLYIDSLMKQPNTEKVLRSMVFNYIKAKQYAKAEKVAQRRVELFPEEVTPANDLAYVHVKLWDPEAGLKATKLALDLKPKNGTALEYEQTFLLVSGRFDEAKAAIKRAADAGVDEKQIACYETRMAASSGDMEDMKKSWAVCETADASPTKTTAEGYKALAEGDEKLAISRLIKAGYGNSARTTMGWRHLEAKRYEKARNLCNAVLKEYNRVDSALISSMAYYGEGDFQKAIDTLVAPGRFEGDWSDMKDGVPLVKLAIRAKGVDYGKKVTEESLAIIIASYKALDNEAKVKEWSAAAKKATGGSDKIRDAAMGTWPNRPPEPVEEDK